MANRAARLARAKKREKIRKGPSDNANAWLTLMGVEISKWPVAQPIYTNYPGHGDRKIDLQATLHAAEYCKAWFAHVKDTPHITKLLYCTCDEQWIHEAKELRTRADAWNKAHPGQMVFPPWVRTGRISAAALAAGYSAGLNVNIVQKTAAEIHDQYREAWGRMTFEQIEARVAAAHLSKEKP